jgi:phosphoglycolate phosphatase-like HAD superfamily hydrolase
MTADLERLELVVFDNDGVVIDSWESTRYFFNTIRGELGFPGMTPEQERFCFSATWPQGLRAFLPVELHDRAMAMGRALPMEAMIDRMGVFDGVVEFLDLLDGRGVRGAVLTNGGDGSRYVLETKGLLHRFAQVVTADDGVAPKPDPEGLNRILAVQSVTPDRALFLGDSPTDQGAADAAGVPFWSFRNPGLTAERTVSGYAELIRLFDGKGK